MAASWAGHGQMARLVLINNLYHGYFTPDCGLFHTRRLGPSHAIRDSDILSGAVAGAVAVGDSQPGAAGEAQSAVDGRAAQPTERDIRQPLLPHHTNRTHLHEVQLFSVTRRRAHLLLHHFRSNRKIRQSRHRTQLPMGAAGVHSGRSLSGLGFSPGTE